MYELPCLSCICAGCPIEDTCQSKPCNESTNPYECMNVSCLCDEYDRLVEIHEK